MYLRRGSNPGESGVILEARRYWQQFEELFYNHILQNPSDHTVGDPISPTDPSPQLPFSHVIPLSGTSHGPFSLQAFPTDSRSRREVLVSA